MSASSRPRSSPSKRRTRAKRSSVTVADLRVGTADSDSVRTLQQKLGVPVTGTYDGPTQSAVRRWQNSNGFAGGRGLRVSTEQAEALFGDDVDLT